VQDQGSEEVVARKSRLTKVGGRIGVWMYRRWDGRGMGGTADAPVVMLTLPGRRTGLPRQTCVRALSSGEGYLVWGTGSGSPTDPEWFRNLRATSDGQVQVGERRLHVQVRELLGEERDRAWASVLAALPGVAKYERKAGRVIPVARLTPR
jgi:deazaflavin-dependent oxidoreductase (nitroreductase family)